MKKLWWAKNLRDEFQKCGHYRMSMTDEVCDAFVYATPSGPFFLASLLTEHVISPSVLQGMLSLLLLLSTLTGCGISNAPRYFYSKSGVNLRGKEKLRRP